jgi:CRISPR/Cas system-associated protein Cas7 (RAMP superfamily)
MEHPLIPDLTDLTVEQLGEKINELSKKLSIAYGMGNMDLVNQLQMALESYRNKYSEKLKGDKGTPFDEVIDIS